MRIVIASDHGGFESKSEIAAALRASGQDVLDFGDAPLDPSDDYTDFVVPLARAVAASEVQRGVALCESGVGVSVAANRTDGVRSRLIRDVFSPRHGVEDGDVNAICMGGRVGGGGLALQYRDLPRRPDYWRGAI